MSRADHPLLRDPGYALLKRRILAVTGLAYFQDKDEALAERLQRRLAACRAAGCAGYLALLEADSSGTGEWDPLVGELTIGETFFFRYSQQFQALRDQLLPETIARNAAGRSLRLWSAGCATGAEAYSLAALVRAALGERLSEWRVTILGTDINRAFLAQARRGEFSEWALRDVAPADRAAVVEPGPGGWRVRPELRGMVEFRHHNLIDLAPEPAPDDWLADFDIILCRNVMIYFDQPTLAALAPKLAARLVSHGWLLIGHAEGGTPFQADFEPVLAPGAILYQRRQDRRTERRATGVGQRLHRTAATARPAPWRTIATPAPSPPPAPLPPDPVAFYQDALALRQAEQAEAAEQALRRAIYLDRGFAMAHLQLGDLLRRRGDLAGALKAFTNALRCLAEFGEDQPVPAGELSAAELRSLLVGQLRQLRA
ncbi:CheR family methyltransferase [Geminicoccus flavidas]|uniref:CheR family methyltransferase n=1 Tax=Geminicoccus flavidas TaxID=2506407 RepID=UPI0013599F0D|nr:protein-glutamate O-methyltransferase CheR [Geminicoccus flavidas]